jgi:tetraacyldisaccharide 4'-kinase
VPYSLAVRLRNFCYQRGLKRTHHAGVPVVSVGNLTVGGTGKTPAVEYVAGFFRRHELRVAILSRGYGANTGPNDEALVLEENLPDVPHLQGADRVALAQAAIEELESEVLVLDDGFQHRRLARALDLVLIDATLPWGHGYLLPRGLLREPLGSLHRAGLILLARCDQVDPFVLQDLRDRLHRLVPAVPLVETCHLPIELVDSQQRTAPLELLRQAPIAAFCGLGNPQAFRHTLEQLGARVASFCTFPDHHAYTREDVEQLHAWASQVGRIANPSSAQDVIVVTTQKDLVKLRLSRLGDLPLWSLRIRLQVRSGQDVLDRCLLMGVGKDSPPEQGPHGDKGAESL